MATEVNRDADADDPPLPQPAPSPSSEGKDANNIRDRVSFSSSSSRAARPSCWGSIRIIHRFGRIRSRSLSRMGSDEHDTRASLGGRGRRCGCGCVCSGGKAGAAVGPTRSLLQRNDFYCDDCNTHV